jgi:hypothetical protein
MANGMRQILFVLVPAAAAILVLSEPMIRLVYQRGEFTPEQTTLVATALFWFAFSLPANGLFLLLTRTFFSLQRPWLPTAIAAGNLAVTALAALGLYHLGVGGIVAATAIATIASVVAQAVVLRRLLGGLELGRLLDAGIRISIASAALAAAGFGVWEVLDERPRPRPRRPDRLARHRPRARRPRLRRRRQAAADSRAGAGDAPRAPALARCSTCRAICWASSRSPALAASRRWARRRSRARCCLRSQALQLLGTA